MAEMMRAFVMKKVGEVALTEKRRLADPGPNGAIIKTTRVLVCTSDTHTVKGAIGERENLTLGHEAVGIVDRLGSEVRSITEGDAWRSMPSRRVSTATTASGVTRRNVPRCWAVGNLPMSRTAYSRPIFM